MQLTPQRNIATDARYENRRPSDLFDSRAVTKELVIAEGEEFIGGGPAERRASRHDVSNTMLKPFSGFYWF
ncbi:unnamed protein product [Pieris brassicae]|uniref:Uncharacterized protein n=1 Tax=Pieris brassicae TaxID=7116 RepID=A0A9P0TCJ7_PIEBR|nr:unnamed protein product [Pieris brassicae]